MTGAVAVAAADGWRVRGGAGGVDAELDDLEAFADALRGCGLRVGSVVAALGRLAVDPALPLAAPLAPAAALRTAAALAALAAPGGALLLAARIEATGLALGAAARTYRAADAAAGAAVDSVRAAAGELLVVAGATAAAAAAGTIFLGLGVAGGAAVAGGLPVLPLLPALASAGSRSSLGELVGVLVRAAGTAGQEVLAAHPELLDLAVLGTSRLLADPGAPVGRVDPRVATGLLLALGRSTGRLRDGRAAAVQPLVPPPAGSALAPVPSGLRGLLAGSVAVSHQPVGGAAGDACGPGAAARVRVLQVDGRHGRAWVVQVPGTACWSPVAGTSPVDLTSDAALAAGQRSVLAASVTSALGEAMGAAHAAPGEPVLLVGHSLGGMVAAGLAADPGFRRRFAVRAVVTAGSPVAGDPVPDRIPVLSLEHRTDPVPRLDGRANPARAGWTTVTADPSSPGPARDPAVRPGRPGDAHAGEVYLGTAGRMDASSDPRVRAALDPLTPFEATDPARVVVRDYAVRRLP
ncbi:MAG: PGAP1-like alpha/beta domain-containing protein [Motilibacteraceae bacterium]